LLIAASLATAATGTAAKIDGMVVATNPGKKPTDADSITLGHPSGTLLVTARFDAKGSVSEATVFRTARRIMGRQVFWKEGLRRMERCITKEILVAIDLRTSGGTPKKQSI
jgi:2-methylaconitate cis-trans-isomerase PrpF